MPEQNTNDNKRFTNTMNHYTQPHCRKTEDGKHAIVWDYKGMEVDWSCECVRLYGKCIACETDFERTFIDNGLTIYGKRNRVAYNFDREIVEIN